METEYLWQEEARRAREAERKSYNRIFRMDR